MSDTEDKDRRSRTDSEGSSSSEDRDQGKRQRVTAAFTYGAVAASPPKFVSLEEIVSASKGIANMALAHEIAVDNDFLLKKPEPAENTLEKVVKETMHRVFWDQLDAQLKEDPPNYTHALILLGEIKETLFSLLLPQHVNIKAQVTEMLDIDLIKQQAEKGVLDFQSYAQWVIHLMSRLCAPARDQKINELTKLTDTVAVFRGILQTLELMTLDWANFHIHLIRPTVVSQSVDYEKKKFADYLQVTPDALDTTRKWLLRHFEGDEAGASLQARTNRIVADAYLELMDWDDTLPYPETLTLDRARFRALAEKQRRLCVGGAVLLTAAVNVPALAQVADFKQRLKAHLLAVLEGATTEKSIEALIPSVAMQVTKDVKECLTPLGLSLDEAAEKLLHDHVIEVGKPDHAIRQLMRVRVLEFLRESITSSTAAPLRVPPGLSSLGAELTALTGHFLRLVSHNRAVFGEHYAEIVAAQVQRPPPVL